MNISVNHIMMCMLDHCDVIDHCDVVIDHCELVEGASGRDDLYLHFLIPNGAHTDILVTELLLHIQYYCK